NGIPITWTNHHPTTPTPLPTYPFQHQHYWLQHTPKADPAAAGFTPVDHPLLTSVTALPDDDTLLFTGRISLPTHPWLADHAVNGTVLLPGTAFLELALQAAQETDTPYIAELTLLAPLTMAAEQRTSVTVQVRVNPADEAGRRTLTVHGRTGDGTWVQHAAGVLTDQRPAEPERTAEWPPPGATAVDVSTLYTDLLDVGYHYGPAFQGVQAVWKLGDEVYADVRLPEDHRTEANRFGVHPALLDATLHALAFAEQEAEGVRLPFNWTGCVLHAAGAGAVRVRLTPTGPSSFAVSASDDAGRPVITVDSLVVREVTEGQLASKPSDPHDDSLFWLDWTPVAGAPSDGPAAFVLAGPDPLGLSAAAAGTMTDPSGLFAPDAGEAVPAGAAVVAFLLGGSDPDVAAAAHEATWRTLEFVRSWLAEERFAATHLVLATSGAVAVDDHEDITDLAAAALWGLIGSVQSEFPGRITLLDTDRDPATAAAFPAVLGTTEPRLAVRQGKLLAPRLARMSAHPSLQPPAGDVPWRLDTARPGVLESLELVPYPEALEPLAPGQVRISVRAAGLNFRDVIVALGVVEGQNGIGGEASGVVLEVGEGVTNVAVGDRVLGLCPTSFGPMAVTDHRWLTRMPDDWTFEQGAALPVTYLTAYYGLVDLGTLQAGESVLIHAAAGGVGTAAVQLARHLGAEVYGTASPGKWEAVRANGVDPERIANSRTVEFEEQFLAATGGRGMDVVLDCLAGEFVDAGL
ncbi:polyketide synthase dehydratase domain-containing protein, partial [Kitasatospora sp. NPDC008050]|uniref:polyketide synthase dehydratase domain-containing protein n=1 Tax=Kitasatospora sp. NPDC008050 TaxID=3364021 RepID=UPI0036ED9247